MDSYHPVAGPTTGPRPSDRPYDAEWPGGAPWPGAVPAMLSVAQSMKGLTGKGVQFTQVPVIPDPDPRLELHRCARGGRGQRRGGRGRIAVARGRQCHRDLRRHHR